MNKRMYVKSCLVVNDLLEASTGFTFKDSSGPFILYDTENLKYSITLDDNSAMQYTFYTGKSIYEVGYPNGNSVTATTDFSIFDIKENEYIQIDGILLELKDGKLYVNGDEYDFEKYNYIYPKNDMGYGITIIYYLYDKDGFLILDKDGNMIRV